jgi:hypothetical protein
MNQILNLIRNKFQMCRQNAAIAIVSQHDIKPMHVATIYANANNALRLHIR